MKIRNALLLSLTVLSSAGLTSCGTGSQELTIVHFDQSILGEAQKDLGVSIGVSKENSDLETALNTALATLSASQRTQMMLEATDRADGNFTTTTTQIGAPSTDSSRPVLTVGLECDYAPFNWTETSATDYSYPIKGTNFFADGYDIQVAMFLANALNYRLEIVKLEWDALIPALQENTINAVIAGMTDTPLRRQSISFTNEYYRSELVLVVKANSKYAKATSLADFTNAKIVSQESTVTDDVIEDWVTAYGVTHLNAMDTFSTCAMAVQQGTADAMTAELPVATAIVNGSK